MPILGILSSSYYVPPSTYDYTSINTAGRITTSTDGNTWTFLKAFVKNQTNIGPLINARSLFYLNNTFFAQTAGTVLNKSTDGITWEVIESNSNQLLGMIYANSKYYKSNNGQVASSTDTITWDYITLPVEYTSSVYIAYGNSTIVAVSTGSAGDRSLSSTDGVTWTSRTFVSLTNLTVTNVRYLNNLFLAYGSYDIVSPATAGVSLLVTSTNGITWTQRTVSPGLGANALVYSVAYGNNYYVLSNAQTTYYSTDAITWLDVSGAAAMRETVYGSAAGFIGQTSSTGNYWKSTDGVTWSSGTISGMGGSTNRSIVYNSGTYYLGTTWQTGTTNTNLWTSTDLVTFTPQSSAPPKGLNYYTSLKKTNGYYFAYGDMSDNQWTNLIFSYSTDAITWTDVTPTMESGTTNLYQLAYGNGTYAIFANTGYYSTSTDLTTWTTRTAWHTDFPRGNVLYADSKFIAYSNSGVIKTSTDAITWTSRTSNAGSSGLRDIVYANNLFVVIGTIGAITTSTDGITWTSRTSNLTSTLNRIAYGNGQYIVVSSGGTLTASTDGVTWTSRSVGNSTSLSSIYYDGSKWVAGAGTASFGIYLEFKSTDGITWAIEGNNTKNSSINNYTAIVQ